MQCKRHSIVIHKMSCNEIDIYIILPKIPLRYQILRVLNFTTGNNYILQVFDSAIWWLQNISRVFNFAISVKIKLSMNINFFIVNQCNCYQICNRTSNFVIISRAIQCTGINIILWSNIRNKENLKLRRYLISRVFNFAILWFWNFYRIQNFVKMVKNFEKRKF